MNEEPKMSPWVMVVVFGVLAVLFAVFGFQQQTEATAMKEELEQFRTQIQLVEREAAKQQVLSAEMAKTANEVNTNLASQLEECQKKRNK